MPPLLPPHTLPIGPHGPLPSVCVQPSLPLPTVVGWGDPRGVWDWAGSRARAAWKVRALLSLLAPSWMWAPVGTGTVWVFLADLQSGTFLDRSLAKEAALGKPRV